LDKDHREAVELEAQYNSFVLKKNGLVARERDERVRGLFVARWRGRSFAPCRPLNMISVTVGGW
jgi:hypothetical protein